ncbi:MAG: hypothetical protein GY821_00810 [Gammaproteobacteria bacterium]|nr:hypothetical protein [Gammaproteobacteria bacterium]
MQKIYNCKYPTPEKRKKTIEVAKSLYSYGLLNKGTSALLLQDEGFVLAVNLIKNNGLESKNSIKKLINSKELRCKIIACKNNDDKRPLSDQITELLKAEKAESIFTYFSKRLFGSDAKSESTPSVDKRVKNINGGGTYGKIIKNQFSNDILNLPSLNSKESQNVSKPGSNINSFVNNLSPSDGTVTLQQETTNTKVVNHK